jgi:hypothetical protein
LLCKMGVFAKRGTGDNGDSIFSAPAWWKHLDV